jgi:uncharacterized protein (DUF1697 family)
MKYGAFFRNLNLGRPNCPTKIQFEEAFLTAGATSASSFLTNGTIAFTVRSATQARKVFTDACELLRDTCGLKESGYLRAIEHLAELVALDPFAAVEPGRVYECCATFLPPRAGSLAELPAESKRGDIRFLHTTGSEVLSVSLKIGKTPGSPNAFLEKLLGSPVTTRCWNTVVRLVEKYGDPRSSKNPSRRHRSGPVNARPQKLID